MLELNYRRRMRSSRAARPIPALVWAASLSCGCSASEPPPKTEVAAASEPRAPAPAAPSPSSTVAPTHEPSGATPASPPPSSDANTDSCHSTEELSAAFKALSPGGEESKWVQEGRERLWSEVDAERALGGIAQEIVSALAHKRYDKVAALTAPAGLCLRPAKGAPCETLSARELSVCAHSGKKKTWGAGKAGGPPPEYSCGEAFRRIFYTQDFLRKAQVHFNCFPDPGRGNAAPVVMSGPAHGYVELADPEAGAGEERSLWLVFDGAPDAPVLTEMIAEY